MLTRSQRAAMLGLVLASCAPIDHDGCPDGTVSEWHGDCVPYECGGIADCGGPDWLGDPGLACEREELCMERSLEGDEGAQMPHRVPSCPPRTTPTDMTSCDCAQTGICRHSPWRALTVRAVEAAIVLLVLAGAVFAVHRSRGRRREPP